MEINTWHQFSIHHQLLGILQLALRVLLPGDWQVIGLDNKLGYLLGLQTHQLLLHLERVCLTVLVENQLGGNRVQGFGV